ncbi:probable serine/threonine-protein kinase DDB_G0278665 isoform X6 [Stomoxys calcitrans]|uniref:probable serine/threonine-protein kinase DDB_G0278665 isoform X6 n=1 Tax=Stomoxys calcitrans TaxID=35570 RepID=UPI0027E30ECF|nr:probable serine/threonine-protein kinase DDB_G0278665 isoform X6 [Stomoxys calcitrans]
MDYISNLIKRPLSLVVAEASTATDKTQTSTSLPSNLTNGQEDNKQQKQDQEQNNSNELNKNTSPKETHSLVLTKEQDVQQNNITDKKSTEVNQLPVTEQQQHSFAKGECSQELTRSLVGPSEFNQPHHRLLSLSSSFNGNFTDFIGVSNELLDLDEFLPPPPPLLSNSILLSPVEDNNNLQSTTPSPPPPPLSPSMMASQTIDELLSEISDNLTLAGINDEVLSIASPPKMSEHSPMSTSKTSLNNSKTLAPSSQAHLPKTPTNTVTAAGTAGAPSPSAVFEANSTLHKFHVDPDLATGLFDDQHFANELENSSGVNKSSNKFVGLTEFDEDKIPELPGDLNPNIEDYTSSTTSLGGGRDTSAATAAAAGSAISSSAKLLKERSQEVKQQFQQHHNQQIKRQLPQPGFRKNATMSVDVIKDMSLDNNDCNKTFENSNSTQPDDKQINYKMDELEKKVKNEVLKTEDIEKKLKEAEQREEALIKRITEKDKTVAKMNGVIEAYEKAIAELIAEKEQLIQNYEKQLAEVKADRDSNYHHLTSLETTFSDLHVKYEKSKEMTCQLKANEEGLIAENRKNAENLRLQEQRYDKMKNHAMQQLEIANKKLECLTREHTMEITKLKALLKKEEIARSSMSEQLAQKSKENAELVKICDELISGQGS